MLIPFASVAIAFAACTVETGGAAGTGGVGATTADTAGNAGATCFTRDGSGGDMYFSNCPEWLDEGLAEVVCDALPAGAGAAGGAGGAGTGTRPALRRLCERRGNIDTSRTRPLVRCLEPLRENPCAPDHEAKVRACLDGRLPPCDFADDLCAAIVSACPEVTPGDCYLGMDWTFLPATPDTPCYTELAADPGDDCRERFLHCAWDL
jgi:hypothetical protein